jgi:3-phytase
VNGALHAEHVRAIGETSGAGVLRVVESIAVDPQHHRLLIADETPGASTIKVYDTNGSFTGTIIDARYFPHQSEGIALYSCDDGGGYWIVTDQAPDESTFHIFDRASLVYIASFRGKIVQHTDGVALTQQAMPNFPNGAFYAVHDDGNVVAFAWHHLARALDLRADC